MSVTAAQTGVQAPAQAPVFERHISWGRRLAPMCRNITELRGLEPPATEEEIEAAAYQFVRKITGVTKPTGATADDMEAVSLEIAALASALLDRLPPRRQPPKTVPPLRRPEVRSRMGLEPFPA
jgi:hypothetical protein